MNAETHSLKEKIFRIDNAGDFSRVALEIFHYQAKKNSVYAEYLRLLGVNLSEINSPEEIPFLPISFFKTHQVLSGACAPELVFESSGTSAQTPSRHYVSDRQLYVSGFTKCFELFFGATAQYVVLALLPSYLERKNSSLVFMADELIRLTKHPASGFFLNDYNALAERLTTLEKSRQKTLLLGVSFALLDFAENFPLPLKHTLIMETGGMKGKRKELTREELHAVLKTAFQTEKIYSEYGMTELLSQAYSTEDGMFLCPPWMKIFIRNPYDPFETLAPGKSGGINIIDLANLDSCSFIQTDDLGKLHPDGRFEVLGRMESAELRGCNLLLE